MDDLNLISKLSDEERILHSHRLDCVSPNDAKYGDVTTDLKDYLSAAAEWRAFAKVQKILLETRVEFGQANQNNVDEVTKALEKVDPLNMDLLEKQVTKHDQLAVIEEIGRFVSEETKSLLHPGTTSYDIVDTARSFLFKEAWREVIRPKIVNTLEKLCEISDKSMDILQVGRTHLQDTSPVPFGATFAIYAARLTERLEKCDSYFDDLKGKISGIVGTGASIEIVVGEGQSLDFEKSVLNKLGLKPDTTATQVVQKESLADVGHGLTTLMHVLGDFANDIRILYSSAINEVTSRDNADRLGGSSADATKNNPINWENIAGTASVVESGMRISYEMISSDLQRDLRGSKQSRYQPQIMMAETYGSFYRANKILDQLSINEDIVSKNLEPIRKNPGEAMVAILRGEGWIHSSYGVGHDFVKEMAKISKKGQRKLLDVSLEDSEFLDLYNSLSNTKRDILEGKLENYLGFSVKRAKQNLSYVRSVINKNN